MKKTTKIVITVAAALVAIILCDEIYKGVRFRKLCDSTDGMKTQIDTVRSFATQARRGDILDCRGNILATSDTVYNVHLDATLIKDSLWVESLPELSTGLAEILGDKSPEWYYGYLMDGRAKEKRYLNICKNVGQSTLDSLKALPLFNLPMQKGGLIVEAMQKRVYPYGPLARRTIGFVRNNPELQNNLIGVEGSFNKALSGKDGYGIIKDKYVRRPIVGIKHIHKATKVVKPENGEDVPIALDIELQAVADSLLRAGIEGNNNIKGACLVLVSTNNGAIRTMVNLTRNERGEVGEYYNVSIGYGYEPGRILAPAAALAAAKCNPSVSLDNLDFTKKNALLDIAGKCEPTAFCDSLKTMLQGEYAFSHLELEGLASLQMITPDDNFWRANTLESITNGYSIMASAFRWLSLYTALARGGEGIAQRLVGPIMGSDGKTLLNDPVMIFVPVDYRLCSKEQADAVNNSLKAASAKLLPETAYEMAGLLGSSFITHPDGGYIDADGRRAVQSSYAGFFPAVKPAFSIICMTYTDFAADSRSANEVTKKVVREFVGSDVVAARVKETFE